MIQTSLIISPETPLTDEILIISMILSRAIVGRIASMFMLVISTASFKFFEFEGKQLDSGEVDIETQESEATND